MSLLQQLDRVPAFHHLVRWLRIRQIAGLLLRCFPRQRTLTNGTRYRCRHLESVLLSDEVFSRNVYRKPLDPATIRTFADLGCNVGYFAVLLAELTGRRDLRGLMIDANPAMIEEARWHVAANGLDQVIPLFGLAGAEEAGTNTHFYLLPSNLGSSQYPVYEPGKPPKGDWKQIDVPRLDLETSWLKHVGDTRCDVLKVDIEGSEKRLVETDRQFLQRVDAILLEWHKWIVPRESIDATLAKQGFKLVEILEDLPQSGIAWYKRDT